MLEADAFFLVKRVSDAAQWVGRKLNIVSLIVSNESNAVDEGLAGDVHGGFLGFHFAPNSLPWPVRSTSESTNVLRSMRKPRTP